MPDEPTIDVAILTALPEEYKAVYDKLGNPHPIPSLSSAPNLYAWVLGEIPNPGSGKSYFVALGMTGRAGNNQSAVATTDAIGRWKPRYVFFVGIAGGFDSGGLQKGDVVVADLIYGYGYGKLERVFLPRNNWVYPTDLALMNGATAFYTIHPNWIDDIQVDHPTKGTSKVFTGQIASGDMVVDDPTNEIFTQVRKQWPKLQAVEMEGAGLATAIAQAQSSGFSVGFMVIRGISDIPRPDTGTEIRGAEERDLWKVYAANAAAAFAVSFIANGLPIPPSGSAPSEAVTEPSAGKMAAFGLGDTNDKDFGKSEFTANLGNFSLAELKPFPALHHVVIAALPLNEVTKPATEVLKAARSMLNLNTWYSGQRDLPKYWSRAILQLPPAQPISKWNAIVVEEVIPNYGSNFVFSRLAITNSAEVVFAAAIYLVYLHNGQIPVFEAGPILARCWSLSALVAQLYHDIGYSGKTYLCIAMANTLNSHLGGVAKGWAEPFSADYEYESTLFSGHDRSCHSSHLKFPEVVELLRMKPKEQPEFITRFGEAMSLAYNYDAPRCFEKNTGFIPERYFR
jgi:nucleoside phosphorylase